MFMFMLIIWVIQAEYKNYNLNWSKICYLIILLLHEYRATGLFIAGVLLFSPYYVFNHFIFF